MDLETFWTWNWKWNDTIRNWILNALSRMSTSITQSIQKFWVNHQTGNQKPEAKIMELIYSSWWITASHAASYQKCVLSIYITFQKFKFSMSKCRSKTTNGSLWSRWRDKCFKKLFEAGIRRLVHTIFVDKIAWNFHFSTFVPIIASKMKSGSLFT